MESILELLYDIPVSFDLMHGEDSPYRKALIIQNQSMEELKATMTQEQESLLDTYFEARGETEEMLEINRFRFAFHLGAQFMDEIIEGRHALFGERTKP